MNREEFMMKYGDRLQELNNVSFSNKEKFSYTTISDNPEQYIDIASQCSALRYILLEGTEDFKYYKSVSEFIKNCNDTVRISNGPVGKSTKQEFLRGEEIIEEIIGKIDPEWTSKQKAAFVHYEMGKIISYAPDFCFSGKYVGVKAAEDTRNIWKSIESGLSVCNGVTDIQRNILSRIGINTKELSSGTHSFMLVETEEGNIITDATWDLTQTLFEARPMYFGKTYEELQQIDGPFSKAHRLEQQPDNVIQISDDELREIYHSIGLTTEDRKFKMPILDEINKIENQNYNSDKEKIDVLLQMFTEKFSEQAIHLSESRTMLENCMITLGIDRKSITTKFVYSKEDTECETPYLSLHIDGEEMKENITLLNTREMRFENLNLRDFDGLYKQHNEDTREPFWKRYLQKNEVTRQIEQERSEK